MPKHSEELLATNVTARRGRGRRREKGADRRVGASGGKILFFDGREEAMSARGVGGSVGEAPRGLTVEEVVLRARWERGRWAGVHCESELILCLMMLLLWEEVFDPSVEAAGGHGFTVRSGMGEGSF